MRRAENAGPEDLVRAIEERMGDLPARVRRALLVVDRSRFVRRCDVAFAYANVALPIDADDTAALPPFGELLAKHGSVEALIANDGYGSVPSTVSQPLIYAAAFRILALDEGDRLLELGTGTGYGASLASEIVGGAGYVTSVEVDPRIAAAAKALTGEQPNVAVIAGDGLRRSDLLATHPKCWLAFSVPERPTALLAGLPEGGVLLAPVGPHTELQQWIRFKRRDGVLTETTLGSVHFRPARAWI